MNEENFKALIAAIDEKKRNAEQTAQMKAMDYVRSALDADRACSQSYLRDAALWNEARNLALKHHGT